MAGAPGASPPSTTAEPTAGSAAAASSSSRGTPGAAASSSSSFSGSPGAIASTSQSLAPASGTIGGTTDAAAPDAAYTTTPASLAEYCERQGFTEFAAYCTRNKTLGYSNCIVTSCIEDLTKALLTHRPSDPRRFLLQRLREEYPLEKFSVNQTGNDHDIGVDRFIRLFEATRNITHEIVPAESINICIRESVRLLQCDRVSIFIYDEKIKMLILSASNLTKPIRVSPGQGIAGHVFKTGETVNIPDCYEDARFDPSFDKLTGYTTKSMLVKPIHDFEGKVTGVLQAINKDDGITTVFTEADEIVIQNFMQLVGITLRNAEVYKDAIAHCKRAQGMSMILTITTHAHELVQSDECAVFLHEESRGTLWSMSDLRIPHDKGILGAALREKKTINVENVHEDPRYCEHENLCGKGAENRAETMLVVPLIPSHQSADFPTVKVMGLVVMQNKREFDGEICGFNEEDSEVMETFAKLAADRLKDSGLFLQDSANPKMSEGARIFGSSPVIHHSRVSNPGALGGVSGKGQPTTGSGSGDHVGAGGGSGGGGGAGGALDIPGNMGNLAGSRTVRASAYRSQAAIREADDEEDEDEASIGNAAWGSSSPRVSRPSGRLSLKNANLSGKGLSAEELDKLLHENLERQTSPAATAAGGWASSTSMATSPTGAGITTGAAAGVPLPGGAAAGAGGGAAAGTPGSCGISSAANTPSRGPSGNDQEIATRTSVGTEESLDQAEKQLAPILPATSTNE